MNEAIVIVPFVFATVAVVLFPLVRALARRIESRGGTPAALPLGVAERLERIERAVESIAVEVERISEGQRFVTRVLADRGEIPRLPPVQH